MHTSRFSLFIALILFSGSSFAMSELEERASIEGAVRRNFELEKFEQLEADSRTYRLSKARTASGLWKLTLFYAGIADAVEVYGTSSAPDANFAALETKTKKWMQQFPGSPTANIAHAMLLFSRGWAHRGTGYATQVKPESWAPFRAHVAAARAHLEKTKSVSAVDPRWYELMLSIARSQGWERKDFDKLLKEALDKEPLFYQTYFLALEYLLPKWHGGVADIESFARSAVERTKHHEGQSMYARLYWFASQTQFQNELFSHSHAVWPRMRDGFEDVVARYPDAWNLNNYAKFACLAGDKKKTLELLDRTDSAVVPEAWSPAALREKCRTWATTR